MELLHIASKNVTLVDQVEDCLLKYFKEKNFSAGDAIPNEKDLATALGVARNVLREALSRLKMTGMIESRPRRGMILREPSLLGGMQRIINPMILSEESLMEMLEFRVVLELGMCDAVVQNITDEDVSELENIVKSEEIQRTNEYPSSAEYAFHSKLYAITGNRKIMEFQELIYPILDFVQVKFQSELDPINRKLKERGELVTHGDLLPLLKARDAENFRKALKRHFSIYECLLNDVKISKK